MFNFGKGFGNIDEDDAERAGRAARYAIGGQKAGGLAGGVAMVTAAMHAKRMKNATTKKKKKTPTIMGGGGSAY